MANSTTRRPSAQRHAEKPMPPHRPDEVALGVGARLRIATRSIDRRRLWSLVLAGVITVLVIRSVGQSRAVVAGFGSLRPVAVAVHDLEPGHVLDDTDIRWESWPVAIASYHPSAEVLADAVVRSPIAAGEPIHGSRLFDRGQTLAADERAVTVPMPLAPPPLDVGAMVELIGLRPGLVLGEQQLIESLALGSGRVVFVDDTGVTVAVAPAQILAIVETIAVGSVEIVITPFGS